MSTLEVLSLPRYVERDFAKYLECGLMAHDFARVRCESCKDELLVAFSCKGRGVCPSCNAKRAQVTAVHLVERVLPHVPYRQWTLSFPHRVRWGLLKDVRQLSDVLTVFLRGVRPTTSASSEARHPSWAGQGHLFHPALRLGLAGDAALPTHLHANDRQGLERLCRYGRVARWRWSDCRGWRMAALRTG
jgi:hypothetical protein